MERKAEDTLDIRIPMVQLMASRLKALVYLVTEICHGRGDDFAICAPNQQVSSRDLRPSWLSYLGYIASVYKILPSVERTGNSQLTADDAIYSAQDTKISLPMFEDEAGEQRLPEPTTAEAIRVHNWVERGRSTCEKTSIRPS